jgi:proteasome accessory factor B
LNLRSRAHQSEDGNTPLGWQGFKIEYRDRARFIEEILWYGNDVIVSEPTDLREEIKHYFRTGVQTYG